MSRKWLLALVLVAVVAGLAFGSMFTIREHEQVILTRFGKIQRTITDPGLHFKAPVIDVLHTIDKRWLEWDGDRNQIPTGDKKYVWVDTYARWRIEDPETFYKRLGTEASAQSRLDDIIDGEIRNVVANHDILEVVRTSSRKFELGRLAEAVDYEPEDFAVDKGRDALRQIVLNNVSEVTPSYGISVGDIRIKRINYVESVQKKVFDRMISERKRIAARYRSEGKGRAAEIRGDIDRELKKIESEAYEKAQAIRGKADAKAASIYANAYTRDPGLYQFMQTLETYKRTIDDRTMLVMSTDSELMKYLEASK